MELTFLVFIVNQIYNVNKMGFSNATYTYTYLDSTRHCLRIKRRNFNWISLDSTVPLVSLRLTFNMYVFKHFPLKYMRYVYVSIWIWMSILAVH